MMKFNLGSQLRVEVDIMDGVNWSFKFSTIKYSIACLRHVTIKKKNLNYVLKKQYRSKILLGLLAWWAAFIRSYQKL